MADLVVLGESNVFGTLTEALTAHIDLVLSNDGALRAAHSAVASSSGAENFLGVSVDKGLAGHFVLYNDETSIRTK